jgi:alpha-1,3-mannosyltransferase
MEVVHIVRQYLPSVGGLEDAVQNLCSNLSRREGVKVRIITLDRLFSEPSKKLPQREIIAGIPVTRISYFGSNRYPIALSILNVLLLFMFMPLISFLIF